MSTAPLLLATRSDHKAAEVVRILAPLAWRVETLADRNIEPRPEEEAIEVFETFRENAIAKALHFAQLAGAPVLADDSGLRVDALDGAPGVRTKRFSGRDDLAGQELDGANNAALLDALRDIPDERRGARYVCCAAVGWPDGRSIAALGTVSGSIARDQRGEGGFGYDPLFHVPEVGARFAEVPAARKDEVSHRARAFRALASSLQASPWPL